MKRTAEIQSLFWKCLGCFGFVVLLLGSSQTVSAQCRGAQTANEFVRSLNSEAINLLGAQDPQGAINLLVESVKKQPFNLLYLNLGRAYQKAGRSVEAREAFLKVASPDVVCLDQPTPAQVQAKSEEWLNELYLTCPGTLNLQCKPFDARVSINGSPAPCNQRIDLQPGQYIIEGQAAGLVTRQEAIIQVMETTDVNIEIDIPLTTEIPPWLHSASWASIIIGGVGLVTGGISAGIVLGVNDEVAQIGAEQRPLIPSEVRDLESQGETFELLQFVGYIVGVVGIAAGTAGLIWYYSEQPEENPLVEWEIVPTAGPDSIGSAIQGRF